MSNLGISSSSADLRLAGRRTTAPLAAHGRTKDVAVAQHVATRGCKLASSRHSDPLTFAVIPVEVTLAISRGVEYYS